MSISNLISDNLNFAISQIQVSLTAVSPTNSETYLASKQDIEEAFDIYETGREETIDTKFYININQYTDLPTKGMILTDGSKRFKVINIFDDSVGVTRRIDCTSEFER